MQQPVFVHVRQLSEYSGTRILESNTAFNLKYQKRLNDLILPSWLVDTFRRFLDIDPWPPSDKAHQYWIQQETGEG
jgi:hypothetical protein